MMSDKNIDKKQKIQKLDNDKLEDVSGGYGIVHRHDGWKTLIDDAGNRVNEKFINTIVANEYASEQKHGFNRGLEWEEY